MEAKDEKDKKDNDDKEEEKDKEKKFAESLDTLAKLDALRRVKEDTLSRLNAQITKVRFLNSPIQDNLPGAIPQDLPFLVQPIEQTIGPTSNPH